VNRLLLLYQTEGAALLKRELESLDFEVTSSGLAEAESALTQAGVDAIVLEAATSADETRHVLESSMRPTRAPLLLLARVEQLAAIDPVWPVDDFLVLPAATDELNLRLRRAIWRKTGIDTANTLRSGDLLLDLANYKVFVAEQPVTLTFKEFELLRFLAEHRGRVFTRPALMREVWGYDFYGGTRTVDVHVRRLRAKLGPAHESLIETVRGVGYRAADA